MSWQVETMERKIRRLEDTIRNLQQDAQLLRNALRAQGIDPDQTTLTKEDVNARPTR